MSTATALVDVLRRCRLLEPGQLAEAECEAQSLPGGPAELLACLVRRGWLTPYQHDRLVHGRGDELLVGSYVLLDKLGEGGMGAVFKAKNWKLGKLVALKRLRSDRLQRPDAVRRFRHEIRAAATLNHPNVVLAYDADQVGDTHLFVMEYIEGTDLFRLLIEHGPLPVAHACEYARQAALGLQHAHEHGLVHRDIKPQNLLLTARAGALVKIADFGLVRMDAPAGGPSSGPLTHEGLLMGTCDYLAPEQADDAHAVDIRADLYALGCTLYHLLAGEVPFPARTAVQKLFLHRDADPTPLEQLRPAVPPDVADVVRRLMAKRPADRFQTPAELAHALAAILGRLETATRADSSARPLPTVGPFADLTASETKHGRLIVRPRPRARGRRFSAAGVALLLGLVVVGLVFAFRSRPGPPPPSPPTPEPAKKPTSPIDFERWKARVQTLPPAKQVEEVVAKLKEQNPGFDGPVDSRIDGDRVAGFYFPTDQVTNLSAVSALTKLSVLGCRGHAPGKGKLADLSPLEGMKLIVFDCAYTRVADLSPLRGMPLTELNCAGTPVATLAPLEGMRLTALSCQGSAVADLSPLRGMPLTSLSCSSTAVDDLAPLKGMKLLHLECNGTKISELTALKGIPLRHLSFSMTKVSGLSPLKGMPLTALYCSVTPVKDLSPLAGMELTHLTCTSTQVSDLRPIANPKLTELRCESTKIDNLKALKGLSLKVIECGYTSVSDLTPLEGMKTLTEFSCRGSRVRDLSPLRQSPLRRLDFSATRVERLPAFEVKQLSTLYCYQTPLKDLSPLEGMPLTYLHCAETEVSDLGPLWRSPLNILECSNSKVDSLNALCGLPITELGCSGTPVADLTPLRGMALVSLRCGQTSVADLSPLEGMPLRELSFDFAPERDADVLRRIRTLEIINGNPAQKFWRVYGPLVPAEK